MISEYRSPTRPATGAYPISSFTWLLIPDQFQDASKRDAIKGFLKWMMTDGQWIQRGSVLREAAKASC